MLFRGAARRTGRSGTSYTITLILVGATALPVAAQRQPLFNISRAAVSLDTPALAAAPASTAAAASASVGANAAAVAATPRNHGAPQARPRERARQTRV